ncbi:hypothetical protein [Micropruina sonneratiae]|uniref:hypothetical protein n=1 Tax=Micropruina sonneratiae TaxID=2986940 RepID=UPI002225F86F|nr:hypothetical protein [Micropruina sp. KQZ13P-5]MCW3158976.1 hypothetical protein [Micropruina sp. KQZ13P-5]
MVARLVHAGHAGLFCVYDMPRTVIGSPVVVTSFTTAPASAAAPTSLLGIPTRSSATTPPKLSPAVESPSTPGLLWVTRLADPNTGEVSG